MEERGCFLFCKAVPAARWLPAAGGGVGLPGQPDDRHSDYGWLSHDGCLFRHGEEHEGRQCSDLQCGTAVHPPVRAVHYLLAVLDAGLRMDLIGRIAVFNQGGSLICRR